MHHDNFDIPKVDSREAISQYVRQEFKDVKQLATKEAYTDTLADFYRPWFYVMRNYDYTCKIYNNFFFLIFFEKSKKIKKII